MSKHTLCLILLLFVIALWNPAGGLRSVAGQSSLRIIFSRTPINYDNETGHFTLGEELTYGDVDGGVCMSYDYFVFKANTGQVLSGQLQSANSRTIYYVIVTSIYQLPYFQSCRNGNMGVIEGIRAFNAPTTLNWTSVKNSTYALVFFVFGYYSGPVYFTQ